MSMVRACGSALRSPSRGWLAAPFVVTVVFAVALAQVQGGTERPGRATRAAAPETTRAAVGAAASAPRVQRSAAGLRPAPVRSPHDLPRVRPRAALPAAPARAAVHRPATYRPDAAPVQAEPDPAPQDPEPQPAPPPPPPVVATGLGLDQIGPWSAVVSFTTSRDVPGVVGFGWDGTVVYASDEWGRDHRILLRGLVPEHPYVVTVASDDGVDKPQIAFTTPQAPTSADASTDEGAVELDGEPFFPVTSYGACAWNIDPLLAAGVNVFEWELGCGKGDAAVANSIRSLGDRAYWTVPWEQRGLADDGMIGYSQRDEPDGQQLAPSDLPTIDDPGRVTFVTFTQHFAPGTGTFPWQTPGYYEGFVSKADVFGVDFYPLQGLCSPSSTTLNHDVQVDLVRLTAGKPTFQWIEVAPMNCQDGGPDVELTPATVRAEMLLAIAGGAHGLGLFPARVEPQLVSGIRATLDEIEQAWPMLLGPRRSVAISGDGASSVRASARDAGGAVLLVVANADRRLDASVDIQVDGLDGRLPASIDTPARVGVVGDVVHLELAPLEAHILVAAPPEQGRGRAKPPRPGPDAP